MKPLCPMFLVVVTALTLLSQGCTSFLRKSDAEREIAEIDLPESVGEVTRPHGLGTVTIESVGLVTGLADTGSDPPQGPHRAALLEDMKKREVDRPNQLLELPSTAIVIVSAHLPPGVQKGDAVDIDVRVPRRSKTSSLEGGWLMQTDLREVAVLNQSVRSGHVRGVCEGPILINSLLQEGDDEIGRVRGQILGGGRATKTRPLGLVLRSEHHNASTSKMVGKAINRRFDTFVRGVKQGAAKPKTDTFIELAVHPRYRDNLVRYLRVIEQIPLKYSEREALRRLQTLEAELMVPATSTLAALKLEAIGDEAISTLLRGLDSRSGEVRFYSAEALAYLDREEAARHLGKATDEPAFRSRALLALGAMSSVEAHDELLALLHVPSSETRYGAFRALQNMNPRDPLLRQEVLGKGIYFHEIESDGEPMVHVSRTRRPEIVTFGGNQPLRSPMLITVDKRLTVKSSGASRLRLTKYTAGADDDIRTCPPTVNDLIRNLVQMDVAYPAIVNVLHQAKQQGCLEARLVFDALPKSGRTYDRSNDEVDAEDEYSFESSDER